MRVLVIDQQGNALDWCLRAMACGHDIKWYVKQSERTRRTGRGLVEIVEDWEKWLIWCDFVLLTDNTLYLKDLDRHRARGVKVLGATEETAAWELDRNKGMEVFRKAGIKVPEYREFKRYDEAIAYVKKEQRRFVSKPCGDEPDKSLSYVAQSPADMVYMLERWKAAKRHKGSFILQEVVTGAEMAVGGFIGPHGFNEGWHENWEYKKLMNGDLGVATGEQGTVLRIVRRSKLADKVLKPLEPLLVKLGYTGFIDVNCIIDEKGTPHPLEFTMRPGWPTFNIQQALVKDDCCAWLGALLEGEDARPFRMDEIVLGVVISIADYPYSKFTRKDVAGIPVYDVTASLAEHLHPCEIMAGEAPQQVGDQILTAPCWVTAGDYVMVVTGCGWSVRNARDKAYRVAARVRKSIPSSPMYRTDIGYRLKKDLPLLQRRGYAVGMEF